MTYENPDEGGAPNDKKLVEIIAGFHSVLGDQVAEIVRERDLLKDRVIWLEDHVADLEMDLLSGNGP